MMDYWDNTNIFGRAFIEQKIRDMLRAQQQSQEYGGLLNSPHYPPSPPYKLEEPQPNKKLLLLK